MFTHMQTHTHTHTYTHTHTLTQTYTYTKHTYTQAKTELIGLDVHITINSITFLHWWNHLEQSLASTIFFPAVGF